MTATPPRAPSARISAMLLGLAATLLARTSGAETPLQAWERIESIKQAEGSGAALSSARSAWAEHPDFLPLTTQYARLRTSQGGFTAARALRDSLRAQATLAQARTAEFFLALEEGNAQAAFDTLALLPAPPRGSPEEAFRWLDRAIASIGIGQIDRGDSLLTRAHEHPAFVSDGRFVTQYMRVFLEQPRVAIDLRERGADAAIERLTSASKQAFDQGFLDLGMRMRHLLGRVLASTGRLEQALAEYQTALELAEQLRDDWQIATTSSWQAWALEQLGRYGEALDHRQVCLELSPRMGDTRGTALTLLGLGWDAIKVGKPDLAEDVLTRAVQLGQKPPWQWVETQALNNLGVLYMDTGRYDRAMDVLDRGLQLAEQSHDEAQRTGILNNVAIIHMERDRPDRAIPIYEQLLAIHRASGDVHRELAILNNLALASENMGQIHQARVMYEQCLETSVRQGHIDNTARINLGRLASWSGRWKEAERYLRSALTNAGDRNDARQLTDAQAELGRCLALQGKMEEALSHLELADSLRVEKGFLGTRIPDLVRLAMVLSALSRWDDALATLDEAQDLATWASPSYVATTHTLRAFALLQAGRDDRARQEARAAEASAWSDATTETIGSDETRRIAAGGAIMVLLRSLQDSDASRDAITREAFTMLQRTKSRSLLEYVQGGQRRIEPDVPDSLMRQEREARRAVDEIRGAFGAAPSSDALDSLRLALAEKQAVQHELRTRIFRSDRRYRDVATPAPFDLTSLADLVGPHTLVLDYLTGRECEAQFPCDAILFAVDAEGIQSHLLGDTQSLNRQIALLLDLLAYPPGTDDDALQLLLGELGRVLLGPVADRLDRYQNLIIVPDGALTRVPFAALLVPTAPPRAGTVYLTQVAAIETVPSLAVLRQLRLGREQRSPAATRWDLAIWPGPEGSFAESTSTRGGEFALPHAKQELQALTSRFPRSTVLDVDLKEEPELPVQLSSLAPLGSTKILHFIAHGFFDDLQPWRSGLYLQSSAPAQEPRKLEIADIYRMNLPSRLVTLSACDTARSQTNEGVGFLGFTQALFGSGATSVLATLWSIDDASTPRFMTAFYENLGQGLSEADALRQAQLGFLANATLHHPFYWAPYVLLGDGAEGIDVTVRRLSSRSAPRALLGLGLLLLLAGLWSWRRERRA